MVYALSILMKYTNESRDVSTMVRVEVTMLHEELDLIQEKAIRLYDTDCRFVGVIVDRSI